MFYSSNGHHNSGYSHSHNNSYYGLQHMQYGHIGTADIQFMRDHNVTDREGKLLNPDYYERTKNSSSISDVNTHRATQEILRDNYNYYSDQKAWNANNKIMHNYINKNFYA